MALTNHDSPVNLHANRAVDKIRVEDKELKTGGGGGGGNFPKQTESLSTRSGA